MNQKRIRDYAKLLVRNGVNVQKEQLLVINAPVEAYEFARMCTEEAYQAGASEVMVKYYDTFKKHLDFQNMSIENLSNFPQYRIDETADIIKRQGCMLSLVSEVPGILKDISQEKLQATSLASSKAMKPYRYYTMSNYGQWTVAAYPNTVWAQKIFPDLTKDAAYEALFEKILSASRVDGNDPVANWNQHNEEISKHTEILNNYNFKSLHFVNELKTDLVVELANGHIWEGGSDQTRETKVTFNPNIPTEEVFTMPNRLGVNGIVYASKPLNYQGKLIEDFWLKFVDGKVVDFDAKKGKDALQNLLDTDENSKYLGEVALISHDSPISNLDILFFTTLFDENASCHLALGAAYPTNLKNGTKMSEEELLNHGGNVSMSHSDFMFGSRGMNIYGLTQSGQEVQIFKDGNFII